jgi:hypothetical protein
MFNIFFFQNLLYQDNDKNDGSRKTKIFYVKQQPAKIKKN